MGMGGVEPSSIINTEIFPGSESISSINAPKLSTSLKVGMNTRTRSSEFTGIFDMLLAGYLRNVLTGGRALLLRDDNALNDRRPV